MILPDATRRAILSGMALAFVARPVGVHADSRRPLGPFAIQDRDELFQRFTTYLSLVDNGDPRQREYHAAGLPKLSSEPGQRTTLRTLALDDGGDLLAAEFRIDRSTADAAAAEPEFDLRFYRIASGYISEIIPVINEARFIRGDGSGISRPPKPAGEPLPTTVNLRQMTRAKFQDYLKLFSRFDERFLFYYAEDVVFTAAPAPAPLHGREAILDLYRPLRENLGEDLTVHQLVIDSRSGLIMAALTNRLTAYGRITLPSSTLNAGDQLLLSGAIVYGLRDGRINLIRDVGA